MKRILCACVSVLIVAYLYGEKSIGTVNIDENRILNAALINGQMPAIAFYEERRGFISDITEYFVLYKGERLGPYDDAFLFSHSGDLTFWFLRNDKCYIYIDKEEVGPFDACDNFTFSSVNKTLTYSARVGDRWYVYTGKEKKRVHLMGSMI